jgi:hypothetical protein
VNDKIVAVAGAEFVKPTVLYGTVRPDRAATFKDFVKESAFFTIVVSGCNRLKGDVIVLFPRMIFVLKPLSSEQVYWDRHEGLQIYMNDICTYAASADHHLSIIATRVLAWAAFTGTKAQVGCPAETVQ